MSGQHKRLRVGGEYWYFNGQTNPTPVRIVEAPAIKHIGGSVLVRDRSGREHTSINAYIFRNHEIRAAVADHANDLLRWVDEEGPDIDNGIGGLDHEIRYVPMGLIGEW